MQRNDLDLGLSGDPELAHDRQQSLLKKAVGNDWKGKASPFFYLAAIAAAFWWQWISQCLYVLVALLWLVPDRRIERVLTGQES